MKKANVLFLALASVAIVGCSETTETEEPKVEQVTYTLDEANSSLEWKAGMGPEYFHVGTVKITEGNLVMAGDELVEGSFTIDMNTIESTDLDSVKKTYLAGHLTGTMPDENHPVDMFFNTPKYPTVKVTLGDYKDGKLGLTLNIIGKELKTTVPVVVKADENGASLKGKFSIDFSSLGMPGLQPNPEDGSAINPEFEFNLNAVLTK